MNVLKKFYGKNLEFSVLFDKYFKHINTIKNYYKEKYESRFGDYRRVNIKKLEEYVDRKVARIPVSKQLAVIDKSDLLVSSDYNSLYPSAMAHPDSKWPKIETAKAIRLEDSDYLCELFNNREWKNFNKTGFFKIKYDNSENIVFQHMNVKEKVFNDRRNRYEEINRFRNGDITQHLTSVDIEEVVRSGGYIVKILEGFICDNLEINPFERFIIDLTNKRNKYKEENKTLLQTLTKKVSNAVYGGCIKDIEESYKCVTQSWMRNEYDESVIEWFPLKNGNIMVKIKDKEGVDDGDISKKVKSQPCHLGSLILSHSKRLMNDVILALDGFKNHKIYYGDTDSVYIHNNDYEILKTKGLNGKDLYQSKNDYGTGGILFGLFLAPKIKYCIVIDENGILSQKTTFKGYDQNMVRLNFKDFLDLDRGDIILGKSKLNWKRDLHGVKVPQRIFQCPQCDNDKICKQCEVSLKINCFECEVVKACRSCLNRITQIKYYSTEINKLKRLPENDFGHMLPHYTLEEI